MSYLVLAYDFITYDVMHPIAATCKALSQLDLGALKKKSY